MANHIDRAKTAIARNNFSKPVQHLLETRILNRERSFFDYGCGRGDDITGLGQLGFQADGWDPAHRTSTARSPADVVNLGFVLNVIEDQQERLDTLRSAWELARRSMIVSVISVWDRPSSGLSVHGDGHVTSRGTFQRYYEPGELKDYVDTNLKVQSIPASPTSVVCFKDDESLQEYLASQSFVGSLVLPKPKHRLRKSRLASCLSRFADDYPNEWDVLWRMTTALAMAPSKSLVASHPALRECGVGPVDVLDAVVDSLGPATWDAIVERVRSRLITQVALGFFRGTPRPKHFGELERQAIRAHFGSFHTAAEESRQTLFSIGNPGKVTELCEETRYGVQDEQALYVHRSHLEHLPPTLQTYVGAGRLFHGDLSEVDIFKIHKASSKLTLLLYDDFQNAEPILQTRVKIDYKARRVNYYDHRSDQQVLCNKKSYLQCDSGRQSL